MALVVTIADPDADSYVTVTEANDYISTRTALPLEEWSALNDGEKESRLRLATLMLDSLTLRGIKATKAQALAFPRLLPGSKLWPSDELGCTSDAMDYHYDDWAALEDEAANLSVDAPIIPENVKNAQSELALLYAHYIYGLSSTAVSSGTEEVLKVATGDLTVEMKSSPDLRKTEEIFHREAFSPGSVVYFLLRRYLAKMRGFSI